QVAGNVVHMRRGRPWSLAAGYRLWMLPPAAFMAGFFILPPGRVVVASVAGSSGRGVPGDRAFFGGPGVPPVLGFPPPLALVVTLATLVLGYPVAWAVTTLRGRWRSLALGLILLPFWTSAVIRSYAWLVIFQRRGPFNQALLATGLIDAPLRPLNSGLALDV